MVDAVKHKAQRSESKLTPSDVRIAYPFVHEKRTKTAAGAPLKAPRHDAVVLFPKLHTDPQKCPNYMFLVGLIMEAVAKEPTWGGGWPQGGKWPIQDGDVPHQPKPKPGVPPKTPEQIAAGNAWRKGNWVAEVSSNVDPGPRVAVLQNGQAIEIPARVVNGRTMYKSGDYGRVSMHAYTYQNETWGANFGIEGILWTHEGEAIGSSGPRSAAQMFGDVVSMAPPGAAPAPPPGTFAPPPVAPVAAPPQASGYVPPGPPPPAAPPAPPANAGGLPPFPAPR
jgi:hypothetical protein